MPYSEELYNWNLVFMKRIGYLGDRRCAYFILSFPVLLCYGAIYGTYKTWNDFDKVVINLFKTSGLITITIRAFVVIQKEQKFYAFFDYISQCYVELQSEGNERTLRSLHEFVRKAKRNTKSLFIIMIICIFYISLIQIMSVFGIGLKKFLVEIELPFINTNESPYWDILSVLQAIWLAPEILLSYISYLCTIFTSISFGILLMKDLQFKLENMNEKNDVEASDCIKKCVKQHVMIIKYHRDMEVLFSIGSFADVCIFCIIPCVIIVYSKMDYNMAFMMTDIQLAFIVVTSTFFNFWLANNFCIESLNIAHAAYNSNWTDRNKEFRKYIVLIMTMGQKPLQLTAGGLKPINMEFFLAILRVAYSLFTVLQ